MTETLTVTPELLRVFLALPERLAALESAVRDLANHIESGERSRKCTLRHVQPAQDRLLAALPTKPPGIIASAAAKLIGCCTAYTAHHLIRLAREGLVVRVADGQHTNTYWRPTPPSDKVAA